MKTLSRRTALAAVPALAAVTALAATPVLAALVPSLDGPLDMTPEVSYWDQIADGIEHAWHKGKMPKYFARMRTEFEGDQYLVAFADALEGMWRRDKMPEALAMMRTEHASQLVGAL